MGTSTAWVWILNFLWKDADWIISFDAWSGWIWGDIFIASQLVGLMLVIARLPDGWTMEMNLKAFYFSISVPYFVASIFHSNRKGSECLHIIGFQWRVINVLFFSKSFKFKSLQKILLDWPTVRELDACDTIKIRFGWSYCCTHVIQAFINLQFSIRRSLSMQTKLCDTKKKNEWTRWIPMSRSHPFANGPTFLSLLRVRFCIVLISSFCTHIPSIWKSTACRSSKGRPLRAW